MARFGLRLRWRASCRSWARPREGRAGLRAVSGAGEKKRKKEQKVVNLLLLLVELRISTMTNNQRSHWATEAVVISVCNNAR